MNSYQSLLCIEAISSTSPTLLAWSSDFENKIRIVELETKQEFANFNGVKLNNSSSGIFYIFVMLDSRWSPSPQSLAKAGLM